MCKCKNSVQVICKRGKTDVNLKKNYISRIPSNRSPVSNTITGGSNHLYKWKPVPSVTLEDLRQFSILSFWPTAMRQSCFTLIWLHLLTSAADADGPNRAASSRNVRRRTERRRCERFFLICCRLVDRLLPIFTPLREMHQRD